MAADAQGLAKTSGNIATTALAIQPNALIGTEVQSQMLFTFVTRSEERRVGKECA